MTQPTEPTTTTAPTTTDPGTSTGGGQAFTQADVDRIVGERLNRERGRYADYEQVKERAGQYDQLSGQLDGIRKALGLEQDTVDPAQLTAQLTEQQATAASAQMELHVWKTAAKLGADPARLLDSRAFAAAVDELPDNDFDTKLEELIKKWVGDNAGLRANGTAQAPAGRQPVEALRPGALPAGDANAGDPNEWMRNKWRGR